MKVHLNKHFFLIASFCFLVMLSGCKKDNSRGMENTINSQTTTIQSNTATGELTVNKVVLDFYPNSETLQDPKENGNQFVKVELTVKNTGDVDFDFNYTSFHLDTAARSEVTETFLITDLLVDDRLKSVVLKPGEETKGSLYFEVAGEEDLNTMSLVYEGYNQNVERVEGVIKFS